MTVYETPDNCAVYEVEHDEVSGSRDFVSINGEGAHAGELAAFIRFKGCNLNCSYCDTSWANQPDAPFTLTDADALCEWVKDSGVRNVTLTGGEPLLQKES